MKCLALFLLVIQAEKVSSCVFDKVEKLSGIDDLRDLVKVEKNECFAECYNDKSCIALNYDNLGNVSHVNVTLV
ncbi:unnamed protein product [Cylicocyclus nassatus]|uniref:Apple domain-containing protein n=1 Tax=Cylicocyclus nassatus TaxID=53992 RepID=A0AA36M682_CYLNA|nr:unnamed protein product [Cylicocyclus nassatus]